MEAPDESDKAVATRAPSAPTSPGRPTIFKKQSTLGSGKSKKEGVKFADSKGGKLTVSVYVENLYYLTSSRYVAAQEAAAAAAERNQPAGCCIVS